MYVIHLKINFCYKLSKLISYENNYLHTIIGPVCSLLCYKFVQCLQLCCDLEITCILNAINERLEEKISLNIVRYHVRSSEGIGMLYFQTNVHTCNILHLHVHVQYVGTSNSGHSKNRETCRVNKLLHPTQLNACNGKTLLRKGQPLYNGQDSCAQHVLYSEV